MIKILDNSLLSSITRDICSINLLQIIEKRYDIYLSNAVVFEYKNYKGNKFADIDGFPIAVERNYQFEEIIKLLKKIDPRLGPGECDTIASSLILSTNGVDNYILIDDKLARKIIDKLQNNKELEKLIGGPVPKINCTGLIGLIDHLYQRKIITLEQRKSIAFDLSNSNFRVSNDLLDLIK